MAYVLKYNLQQSLRDESKLFINIYEDGGSGSVYSYTPTSITITPNSNSDEPEPGIISSQLNFSFLISTQDDFNNFPSLLSFNDRQYYVELTRTPLNGSASVVWKGFMFNDYVNVPFSTGNIQVDITCIDALSFMKNSYSPYSADSNQRQNLYSVIAEGLNSIGFVNFSSLYQCCSYYGSLMYDRSIAADNDPFEQTYIYIRDLQQQNYYDLIEQIVKSFGCRLFQQAGDWWIIPANQMAASTIYYTKFNLSTGTKTGGTLSNGITISPYNGSNVHFVNNSQNKITRKGYPVINVNAPVKFSSESISNGRFKITTGSAINNWSKTEVGSATITLLSYPSDPYNVVRFVVGAGGGNATIFSYASPGTLPYFTSPGFTFSFDTAISGGCALAIRIYVENTIGQKFYANSSGVWGAPGVVTTYNVNYTAAVNVYQTITYNLELGNFNIGGTNYNVEGYFRVEFECTTAGTILLRYPHANQTATGLPSSLLAKRYVTTTNSLTKDFDSSLGIYRSDIPYCYGALFYSNGAPITAWYRYSHLGTTYSSLPILIARELSNLFNRNYATLEANLGQTVVSNNVIYLNNTYTITDSATNALTYTGKKFIANRTDVNLYINQENNLQLLEITDTDNSSTESISWSLNS